MIRQNDTQNIMTAGALISCAKDRHLNQFTYIPRSKFQRGKGGSRNRVGAKLKSGNSENVAHLVHHEEKEPCPLLHAIFTYLCYAVLILVGYINDLIRPRTSKEKQREVRIIFHKVIVNFLKLRTFMFAFTVHTVGIHATVFEL